MKGAIIGCGNEMAAKLEVAVHTAMSGEEALGLPYRFEPLHLPLSSPGRLMRNLYSVVGRRLTGL